MPQKAELTASVYSGHHDRRKGREAQLYRKQASGQLQSRGRLRHPRPENPGPSLPSGPGKQARRNRRRSQLCRRTAPAEATSRGRGEETDARHLPVPARHGAVHLRCETVGGPGRDPRHPVAVHQPETTKRRERLNIVQGRPVMQQPYPTASHTRSSSKLATPLRARGGEPSGFRHFDDRYLLSPHRRG